MVIGQTELSITLGLTILATSGVGCLPSAHWRRLLKIERTVALILGFSLITGLLGLGYLVADGAVRVKEYERTVTVKGLAERELLADAVIWPISFAVPDNDLSSLYTTIDGNVESISGFLIESGINAEEISTATPSITDKSAQSWGEGSAPTFRYTAQQSVTVYSTDVERVRGLMSSLSSLGKSGIAFTGSDYENQPQYLFTRLNDIKPDMIEEATRNARQVAEKFAEDSQSRLGKIKRASQGQFSVEARDQNNPQIKIVRVVSTVEYYLSD